MVIFRRKQFLMMFFLLTLSFSVYFANNANIQNRAYDITQVSTLPVHEKVIIVDAGHGRRGWSVLLLMKD